MNVTSALPLLLVVFAVSAADPTLEQILTKEEQQAIGISSMKPGQREALRRALIDMYRMGMEKGTTNAARTPRGGRTTSGVIESQIDGDFEGWEGETIVKLMNGQIWQQIEYHYEYHYAFMPEVLIYQSSGGYKMKVEGTDVAVGVFRLK
jgi:hypothetical protein